MIEEIERNYAKLEEESLQEDDLIKKDEVESELAFDKKVPKEQGIEVRVSYFFMELFICSLILWSLLFVNQSAYSQQITGTIRQILKAEIQSKPVQEFITSLEDSVKQIL